MSDWIEWSGGECPVEYFEQVEAKLRNGNIETHYGEDLFWYHDGRLDDIIAYKVIEQ